jgi:AcrR family transcriptional regulator
MPERAKGGAKASRIGRKREQALAKDQNEDYRARRADLVKVAATVFNDLGYEATTLSDIAERFGTDRASVYYYVSGKEELLLAGVEEILGRNLSEIERIQSLEVDAREKLELLIRRLVDSYVDTYPLSYVYIQNDMTKVGQSDSPRARALVRGTRRFEKSVIEILQQGVDEGIFDDQVPVLLAANSLFGILNWTHRWFKPGGRWKTEELADSFSRIFFKGIAKPA